RTWTEWDIFSRRFWDIYIRRQQRCSRAQAIQLTYAGLPLTAATARDRLQWRVAASQAVNGQLPRAKCWSRPLPLRTLRAG
ncbi:MAG TPA: hypothetical protein VNA31_10050, partial [bacterium]|nr:hypothetical protein [bacterium]